MYALVTYERGHIYKQEVVLLKGNSTIYKLPITSDMAPMAYVSVVVVSGAENAGKPDFKIGMAQLNVDTSHQTLDVSVTADKKSAGPGEDVTYTITTKDYSWKAGLCGCLAGRGRQGRIGIGTHELGADSGQLLPGSGVGSPHGVGHCAKRR